jgi:hypothetical protein
MRVKLFALVISLGVASCVSLADPPDTHLAPAPGNIDCSPGIAWWAIRSDTGSYLGYYVGGGAGHPCKAEPRQAEEGTWGWDYQGWLLPRRVMLGWWHGQRYQGGTGAYKTDGPHLYHPQEEEK